MTVTYIYFIYGLCVMFYSMMAWFFWQKLQNVALTDSTPSHCGMVVMGDNGPLLVHASTTAGHLVVGTPQEYMENNDML